MIRNNFFLLLIILIISSCVDKRDLSQNTVIAHILSQPDGLHPFNDNSAMRSFVFEYTQKTLLKLDLESLEYIPLLSKSLPTISEDGLRYTFELRDDVYWDDGSKLTVDDVVFTTKIMLCPLTNNAQIRSNYNTVIKSIETYEDDPLKFTMHAHNINYNNKTIYSGLYIQQAKYWDPKGIIKNLSFEQINAKKFKETEELSNWFNEYNNADNSYQPKQLKGLGAYQVTEWEASQYITLEKKKNWWGENDTSIYSEM